MKVTKQFAPPQPPTPTGVTIEMTMVEAHNLRWALAQLPSRGSLSAEIDGLRTALTLEIT